MLFFVEKYKKPLNSLDGHFFGVAMGCRDNVEPVDEGAAADEVGLVLDSVADQNDERKLSGLRNLAADDVLVRVASAALT